MSRILISVGTDFHPFQRLVDWADDYARRHPEHEVFIQYGTARPPLHSQRSQLLDHSQLQTEIARADVVVCHGGPATITEVRRSGLVPVCVARDPSRGEHVDEHQQRFVARIAQAGMVVSCPEVEDLDDAVTTAMERPRSDSVGPTTERAEGVQRLQQLLGDLMQPPSLTTDGDDLRIVYIGGQGRSGSTLIERALGELPGVVSVGEMVHLWERGLRDDELCGCGTAFSSCAFWREVGEVAFGGWQNIDADEAVSLRFAVDRNRFLPLLTRPGLSSRYQRLHHQYAERVAQVYRAVATVSGARVIIDSSKHASYALILSTLSGIDLRLLHVVRDSRAVAHAWTKTVARPEAGGIPMPIYGPAKAAVLWDVQNAVIERLRHQHPYLRLRYEDFVASPKDVLLDAARFTGVEDDTAVLEFLDGDTLHLRPSHTVAGNPMRFVSGDVTIRSDQSWQREMSVGRRRFVTALTLPWQRHYGYDSRLS